MTLPNDLILRNFVKRLYRQLTFGQTPSLEPLFTRKKILQIGEVREDGIYLSTNEVHEKQRIRQLQGIHLDTVRKLGDIVEGRDPYTDGHTDRMATLARRLSEGLGWQVERQESLEIGVYLHDVGKIGVPEEILNKKGALTKKEFKHILRHPQLGVSLLKEVDFLQPAVPHILYHQERYDGSGYPFGLAGKKIPLEGRVMAALDTFDNLIRERPYRPKMDWGLAVVEFQRQAGTQLDPEIVEVFIETLSSLTV
ncbi:MAG: HD-GYP domain-containing protein [Nitrospirae bacterium]|nr:HD-GYP domain-containing protein [Nitrospirota bacterium]